MNMLRVWGGGIYEDDAFYELCDEMGICIWQDFMFACATYPSFDGGFMANVKAEAEDNVRRIRHHACLALWCGNNEIEQGLVGERWTDRAMSWRDYKKLFDRLLPSVVRRLNPDTAYWPCSPHSPHGNRMDFNNPRCGDAHLWSVWHGRKPFEWYRTCEHRFNSEFGFQSFPEPSVVKTYAAPGQRNITSPVMEWHQRSGIGNAVIVQYMLDWFRMPDSFENMLWLSQILQGMAMKYAVEHWRRSMPRGMGTLYWQLNDCWPVASWSSIDYPGNWKALHYMARRFYAPVLASGIEDAEAGTVELHVTNDRLKPFSGNLEWRLTDLPGKRLAGQTVRVNAGGRKSVLVETVELSEVVRCMGAENLILWFELSAGGSVVSSDAVTLAKPKRMELPDPRFKVRSTALGKEGFEVNLRAGATALWAWLEVAGARARFSDNFFHVSAGRDVTVAVSPERNMTAAEFAERLRVRSLVDTYR
jgi:beta-mannosidase